MRHRAGVEPTDLADRLSLRLQELGMSANKANYLAGYGDGYVSRIRTRKRRTVSPELLEPLAAALKVRFDWLQRGVGEKELGADPPGVEGLPERAVVGLRVAVGRGRDPAEALGHLQAFCRSGRKNPADVSTQDWIVVALGQAAQLPPPASSADTHLDPRYPAREQAIRMLVDGGEGSEAEVREAADAVAVALSSDEDLPALAWLDDIRLKLRQLRRGGPKVAPRQVTPGEAQADQDETTRRFEDALKGKKKR